MCPHATASKAEFRNFARHWILDLKQRLIRVNAIGPGPTMTRGLQGLASTEPEWQSFKGLKSSRAVLYPNRSGHCLAAGVASTPVGMISMTIRIFSNGRDQR